MISFLRRIAKPFLNEFKRQMCWRKIGEYTFVVHTFGEYKFICGNKTEYSRTVEYGGEKTPLGAFLFLLKAEDVVWDIGASVGLFTAHSAGIAKMVVAFEPDPATFGRLRQNVEINRLSDRTMTHQLALGSKKGQVILRTDGLDGNAPSVADLGRHSHSTMVQLETIDSLISQGLPVPSVMKIDIEGAELSALEGASKLLRSKQKPRLLFVEVHTKFLTNYHSRHDSVEKVLHQSGYNIIGTRKRDDQYHLIAYR